MESVWMMAGGYVARLIKWEGTLMVNICDEELLGKTVKDDRLEMRISKDYFGGDNINLEEALELIRKSQIVNLAGTRIVEKALRANLASRLAVKKVGSTSFLMIFKFQG
ncbi:MAG: DUF424 domain-containing protein [Nitrososphaerales archaeon]